MPNTNPTNATQQRQIGTSADHGGFELKQPLVASQTLLAARLGGAEPHRRRLAKVAEVPLGLAKGAP